ncbi:hypothetical protein NQ314_009290 [Rhamnusium bicolor]|uniref:DUF4371 domain-containing protein n=1 Tax=Rhamnusium bicolor TaxID=1586634 RepID=A0AAV8Y2M0_9CUCU|nr:hypothetical protein NQ314_009290 [Rhamnusium bicolor]
MKRTKGTAVITNVIGETEKNELTEKISDCPFSLLSDESTDLSCTKSSVIIVRYFGEEKGCIVSQFWDLVQVLKPGKTTVADAEHLYRTIIESLKKRNTPLDNLIGFGSDGCNVMMGGDNLVASRLKRDFPGITVLKCLCHSLYLCASHA